MAKVKLKPQYYDLYIKDSLGKVSPTPSRYYTKRSILKAKLALNKVGIKNTITVKRREED